jgi:hypothetical protein
VEEMARFVLKDGSGLNRCKLTLETDLDLVINRLQTKEEKEKLLKYHHDMFHELGSTLISIMYAGETSEEMMKEHREFSKIIEKIYDREAEEAEQEKRYPV